LLHAWQVPGALAPGRQTLELPVVSCAQVLPAPHAVLGQPAQKPAPVVAQHERQYEVAVVALSRVQTPHDLHTSETVHGSPGSPRGVQVPPVQV
jgi:hypothetical protein